MGSTYNEVQPLSRRRKAEKKGSEVQVNNTEPSSEIMQESSSNRKTGDSSAQNWPPSLQRFVSNSFIRAGSLSDEEKVVFNYQLQKLMEMAIATNTIWKNDWELQHLPIFDKRNPNLQLVYFQNSDQGGNNASNIMQNTQDSENNARGQKKSKRSVGSHVIPNQTEVTTDRNMPTDDYDSQERKKRRMARFGSNSLSNTSGQSYLIPKKRQDEPVVGLCQDLEKNYLRLTSEPDPLKVRPLAVLEKSYDYVLGKYRNSGFSYSYINNQFKSIRQDLTVQHIKNDFSIKVYETHARIALESKDLGEFNQCQSQLRYFYQLKKENENIDLTYLLPFELEFLCYRIVYMLLTANHSEINKLRLVVINSCNEDKGESGSTNFFKYISKAFQLQNSIIEGDYHKFFEIYGYFKNVSDAYLIHHLLKYYLVSKERLKALHTISKAYKKLPIPYISQILAFGNSNNDETDSWEHFGKQYKLNDCISNNELDCTSVRYRLQQIVTAPNFSKIDIKGQV